MRIVSKLKKLIFFSKKTRKEGLNLWLDSVVKAKYGKGFESIYVIGIIWVKIGNGSRKNRNLELGG
jgi:hypothetical protein